MLPWLGAAHANPHAEHLAGRRAAAAVDDALGAIGSLIGADPQDLVLTSGATESNNLALQGLLAEAPAGTQLWFSSIEHKAVIEVAHFLAGRGIQLNKLPVDSTGRIRSTAMRDALAVKPSGSVVVSVMHANNEIGSIQPIAELSQLLAHCDAILHSDAAQSVGKIPVDVEELGVDLLSLSSHKFYGPSGIGALYVSPRVRARLRPLFFGGGQQDGLRPGTVPVFLAVGFGAACALAKRRLLDDALQLETVAEAFCTRLLGLGVAFNVLGDPQHRLPGLRSIAIGGADGDDLVTRLAPRLSLSTGSACTSGELRSSHVLTAIGLSDHEARGVIRVGFGRSSTFLEAQTAAELIAGIVRCLA